MDREDILKALHKNVELIRTAGAKRVAYTKVQKRIEEKQNQQPPEPPVCQQIPQPVPPEIIPKTKFNKWIGFGPFVVTLLLLIIPYDFILCICSLIWIPVYAWLIQDKKEKEIKRIQSSPTYQQQYQLLLQEHQRQQELANQQYAEAKAVYDQQTLPQFEAARKQAIDELTQQLPALKEEADRAQKEIRDFYEGEGSFIPEKYRRDKTPMYANHLIKYMEEEKVSFEEALEIEAAETKRMMAPLLESRPQQQYYEEPDYDYYDEPSQSSYGSGGRSFIRDAAAVAVGTAVGNRISDKRRRREQEERDRRFEDEQRRKDSEERHRRAVASQIEWDRVKKLNDERRRKGLPELPLPHREW